MGLLSEVPSRAENAAEPLESSTCSHCSIDFLACLTDVAKETLHSGVRAWVLFFFFFSTREKSSESPRLTAKLHCCTQHTRKAKSELSWLPACLQPVPRKIGLFLLNPRWPCALVFVALRMEKSQAAWVHLPAPTVATCGSRQVTQLFCVSVFLSVKWEGCDDWGLTQVKPSEHRRPAASDHKYHCYNWEAVLTLSFLLWASGI